MSLIMLTGANVQEQGLQGQSFFVIELTGSLVEEEKEECVFDKKGDTEKIKNGIMLIPN
jgi:hypothetical protein